MNCCRQPLILALALLLAVNALVFAGVALNRRGTPDALLMMTERELPLAWNWRSDENSGVALQLDWHQYDEKWLWFGEEKLEELGIDNGLPDDPATAYRQRPLSVKVFAVLEYEGTAWEEFRKRVTAERDGLDGQVAAGKMTTEEAVRRRKTITAELRGGSRLFAVDAGADAAALRARYPDRGRYLIAPAEVRADTDWTDREEGEKSRRRVHGRIERILTDTIHLPRPFHPALAGIPERERLTVNRGYYDDGVTIRPHYRVRVAFGKRYEPWVESIELLGAGELQ